MSDAARQRDESRVSPSTFGLVGCVASSAPMANFKKNTAFSNVLTGVRWQDALVSDGFPSRCAVLHLPVSPAFFRGRPAVLRLHSTVSL